MYTYTRIYILMNGSHMNSSDGWVRDCFKHRLIKDEESTSSSMRDNTSHSSVFLYGRYLLPNGQLIKWDAYYYSNVPSCNLNGVLPPTRILPQPNQNYFYRETSSQVPSRISSVAGIHLHCILFPPIEKSA